MNIRNNFCKLTNPLLKCLGFKLDAYRRNAGIVPMGALSQVEALDHIRWLRDYLKFYPSAVIDVGASDGRWAVPAIELFPEAQFLLVEPLEERAPMLKQLVENNRKVTYCKALLDEKPGKIKFMKHGHQSSVFGNLRGEDFGEVVEMGVTTLDQLIKENNFPEPGLIKLDIEGAELKALAGAPKALASAEIVEMEVSLIPFKKGIPLFHEIVMFMAEHGFRVFDYFGSCGRSLDGMPAQGECIFIKADSDLITDYRWADGVKWS